MISWLTKQFRKQLKELPNTIQIKATELYKIWKDDPWDSGIDFQPIQRNKTIYSISIGPS